MRGAAAAVLVGLTLAACAAMAKDTPLLSLSVEHFRDSATFQDDAATGILTVSTERGYVERHGPLRTVWNDEYLRALINHATGQRVYQVEASFTYGGKRRSYSSAVYQAGGAPQTVALTVGSPEVLNCATGECSYTEHVRFPVDEPMLRELAADALAGHPHLWAFKVVGPPGADYAGSFSSAEIAGLLAKVDEAGAGPSATSLRTPGVAPGELGVGVLRIDATEESPPRSGLLLTAVNRGSVAQKSGLLVGDLLYEIDGREVRSQLDLESALAAARQRTAVTLKYYRGAEKRSATAQF